MAKLTLCFQEKPEDRNLTPDEIAAVYRAANGASAIIKVMSLYATNDQFGHEDDIYSGIFQTLEWLIEPVETYLSFYAGSPALDKRE